jgi:sugar lactone lactonase YvrE
LYVCETARNRILKVVFNENGTYHSSVFKQLSGRFGPTAVTRNPTNNYIYVARFEFESVSSEGLISVYDQDGESMGDINLPGLPEITGVYFGGTETENILYATERSTQNLVKINIKI